MDHMIRIVILRLLVLLAALPLFVVSSGCEVRCHVEVYAPDAAVDGAL